MDIKRRIERNRISDRIKQIKVCINVNDSTIERFRHQNTNMIYNNAQIVKLGAKNSEINKEYDDLENRMLKLDNGSLDDELASQYTKSNEEIKIKFIEAKKKKVGEIEEKKANSDLSKAYYKSEHSSSSFRSEAEMNRTYKHYIKACDSIPEYMLKKLKNMPNNKGYIWKNVYCYGELPREKGRPVTMFEKQRGGLLIIHEFSQIEYKIWHKRGKERKTLYSCTRGVRMVRS